MVEDVFVLIGLSDRDVGKFLRLLRTQVYFTTATMCCSKPEDFCLPSITVRRTVSCGWYSSPWKTTNKHHHHLITIELNNFRVGIFFQQKKHMFARHLRKPLSWMKFFQVPNHGINIATGQQCEPKLDAILFPGKNRIYNYQDHFSFKLSLIPGPHPKGVPWVFHDPCRSMGIWEGPFSNDPTKTLKFTPPKTNSSPLKIVFGRQTRLSFSNSPFLVSTFVSFAV